MAYRPMRRTTNDVFSFYFIRPCGRPRVDIEIGRCINLSQRPMHIMNKHQNGRWAERLQRPIVATTNEHNLCSLPNTKNHHDRVIHPNAQPIKQPLNTTNQPITGRQYAISQTAYVRITCQLRRLAAHLNPFGTSPLFRAAAST